MVSQIPHFSSSSDLNLPEDFHLKNMDSLIRSGALVSLESFGAIISAINEGNLPGLRNVVMVDNDGEYLQMVLTALVGGTGAGVLQPVRMIMPINRGMFKHNSVDFASYARDYTTAGGEMFFVFTSADDIAQFVDMSASLPIENTIFTMDIQLGGMSSGLQNQRPAGLPSDCDGAVLATHLREMLPSANMMSLTNTGHISEIRDYLITNNISQISDKDDPVGLVRKLTA